MDPLWPLKRIAVLTLLVTLMASGTPAEGRAAQSADLEQRIETCMAARDSECLLEAATALAPQVDMYALDTVIARRIAFAQLGVGDSSAAMRWLRRLEPYLRPTRALASIAEERLLAGDIDGALSVSGQMENLEQQLALRLAIGVALIRSGETDSGLEIIEVAEAEARRADLRDWSTVLAILAVARARDLIGDRSSAIETLRVLHRRARNAGLQRHIVSPIEQNLAALGDIPGVREVIATPAARTSGPRLLIELARALIAQGDTSGAGKFLQEAVTQIRAGFADDDWTRDGRALQLLHIAEMQAGYGADAAALSTAKAAIEAARGIEEEIAAQDDSSQARGQLDTVAQVLVRSWMLISTVSGEFEARATALTIASEVERPERRAGLLMIAAEHMADRGDRGGARHALEQALDAARVYVGLHGDLHVHQELVAVAAGFPDLAALIREEGLAIASDVPRDWPEPEDIWMFIGFQLAVGDADGVIQTLRLGLSRIEDGQERDHLLGLAVNNAVEAAWGLAESGDLDGAYRVAEVGLTAARGLSEGAGRARAFVELALAPEHYPRDLRISLPIDDIVSPR